jgi:hypothetical protein
MNKLKTPNFTDPRVIRRLKNSLGYVLANMSVEHDNPKPLYCRDIAKHLGAMQNPLSKWVKYHLLTCVDDSFDKDRGKCKKYILNLKGTRYVSELVNYNGWTGLSDEARKQQDNELAIEWATNTFDIDNVEYKEKSDRYWNPIQNLRKEVRNQFLARNGLTEQYDVECCAQSIMYQTYQQYSDKPLMMMEEYIENRTAIRNKIAKDVGLHVAAVKQILTAMNNNSRLQANNQCSIYYLTGYSPSKVIAFNNHPSIVYLKEDMKQMWKVLSKHMEREYVTTSHGITRKVTLNGSSKSALYFSLEKQVMDIAYNYLETNNKRFIKLHDAFITEPITQQQLEDITQLIKSNTNYNIKLEKSTTSISRNNIKITNVI